ncbi:unnamed protein product [Adineta steineri]|uniref:Uncharacterized protein n=1 Tax=Adineta steineri TaxID=433720 RepID=A0A819K984_9BILA|nr:unnamed protein product [Adineta steineri]
MPFKRKVHVLSEEDTTITSVRSTSGTILSSLRFKIPVISVIILLFVASIVIPVVLVIRSNDKTSSSSFSTTEDVSSTTMQSTPSTSTTRFTQNIISNTTINHLSTTSTYVLPIISTTRTTTTTTSITSTTSTMKELVTNSTGHLSSSITTTTDKLTEFPSKSSTSLDITTLTSTTISTEQNNNLSVTDQVMLETITTAMIMINTTEEELINNTFSLIESTTEVSSSKTSTIRLSTTTTINQLNLLRNPGGEEGSILGWTQMGPAAAIIDSNGNFNKDYYPRTGSYCFAGGHGSDGDSSSLLQNIPLLTGTQRFTETQLDSGILKPYDETEVKLVFRSSSHAIIRTDSSGSLACKPNPGWCPFQRQVLLPPGARSIDYVMTFIRKDFGGSNIDSYIDDNSLRMIY